MTPEELRAEIGRIIGECSGSVSMCWQPRPSGVFDSQPAVAYVDSAVDEIMDLFKASEGSEQQGGQS